MKTLHVIITNKIAEYVRRDGDIVCGNSDYEIEFSFDSEWDAYESKVARFIWGGKFYDVAFTGNICEVPIIRNTETLSVGVYAGDLSTTTSAIIGCKRSILCGDPPPQDNMEADYANEAQKAAEEAKAHADRAEAAVSGVEGFDGRITTLEEAVAELMYDPMAISSFSNNVATAEMGSTVTSVTLTWALNKVAKSVTLDGVAQSIAKSGSKALTGQSITSNKTWTLIATDERGKTASKTTGISFLNGIYYGAGATFDISALTKTLSNTKGRTFTADAGEGEYLWYVVPSRLGTCTFKVGGFDGGFSLLSTASVTNASGYAEEYYIYRSDNASLGSTTVVVS